MHAVPLDGGRAPRRGRRRAADGAGGGEGGRATEVSPIGRRGTRGGAGGAAPPPARAAARPSTRQRAPSARAARRRRERAPSNAGSRRARRARRACARGCRTRGRARAAPGDAARPINTPTSGDPQLALYRVGQPSCEPPPPSRGRSRRAKPDLLHADRLEPARAVSARRRAGAREVTRRRAPRTRGARASRSPRIVTPPSVAKNAAMRQPTLSRACEGEDRREVQVPRPRATVLAWRRSREAGCAPTRQPATSSTARAAPMCVRRSPPNTSASRGSPGAQRGRRTPPKPRLRPAPRVLRSARLNIRVTVCRRSPGEARGRVAETMAPLRHQSARAPRVRCRAAALPDPALRRRPAGRGAHPPSETRFDGAVAAGVRLL